MDVLKLLMCVVCVFSTYVLERYLSD